ncbi:hypothetical protein ADUPG1_010425, partial [Aduncisulcus paluster]
KEEEEEGETVLKPIPKLIGYKLHVIAGAGIVKDKLTEPESTIFPPDEHFSSFMKDLIIHADINSWSSLSLKMKVSGMRKSLIEDFGLDS